MRLRDDRFGDDEEEINLMNPWNRITFALKDNRKRSEEEKDHDSDRRHGNAGRMPEV